MKDELCLESCTHPEEVSFARQKMATRQELADLAELFKALGDNTRIRILNALQHSELCVCDLVNIIDMTQSAVSHQLRVLRAAKIVKYRKEGKNVYYSLDDQHIRQLLNDGLEHVNEP
jgi:ArsR family transcriptional regulator, lead/cadmium/zinc/bismuth-responsive transcriptional repressor